MSHRIRVPGDKSVSHRALLFAALAEGESEIEGLLPGADCQSTASCLRMLGVEVPDLPTDGARFRLRGVGPAGLRAPAGPLDCGNSGTTARLLLGVLAGIGRPAVLTGDASLRSRPMRRVTAPLEAMGSRFRELGTMDRLPIEVLAQGEFRGGRWILPVASAQVKSALLLAGLLSGRPMAVEEPGHSRDHTERMLRAMGVPVHSEALPGGRWRAQLSEGPHPLHPLRIRVPGDPSSAAFLVALAALGGAGGELILEGVGLNPTRTGVFEVFRRMGVDLDIHPDPSERTEAPGLAGAEGEVGEPSGTLVVRPSRLVATEIGGAEIPSMIDELPLVAALAARARGTTRIRDAEELRVKESDRIAAMAANLGALGVGVEAYPDGLSVTGSEAVLSGRVAAFHDHRIAMAFGVLGAVPGHRIDVDDPSVVEVSFPGFWEILSRLGRAEPTPAPAGLPPGRHGRFPRPPMVTLDGPAGSGKSTTARAVAQALGFLHLDSGALYRAVTLALLEASKRPGGRPESAWAEVTEEELASLRIRLERHPEGFRVRIGDREPGEALRDPEVTARVSAVARIPAVRQWLLNTQRQTGEAGGVVTDGRDMGTVVFPDAEVKVFLVADLRERARRRLLETEGPEATLRPEAVAAEAERLRRRDEEDEAREVAPLRPAPDARKLDTTGLDFPEQVARIVAWVEAERGGAQGSGPGGRSGKGT